MAQSQEAYQRLNQYESALEKFVLFELKRVVSDGRSDFLEKCLSPDSFGDNGDNPKLSKIEDLSYQVLDLRAELGEDPLMGVSGIILFYENLVEMDCYPDASMKKEIASEKLEELQAFMRKREATASQTTH